MGRPTAEQTVAIIDSVANAIDAATPEVVKEVQPEPNYWWLLSLAIIPVIIGWLLNRRKV
jgi:hypothetical protein